jgi:hypothetical protein
MGEGDTLPNALIGAVVTTLTVGAVPLAPVLGGAAAGYLQGGTRSDGVRIGVWSGVVALIPALLLGTLVFGFLGSAIFGGAMGPGMGPGGGLLAGGIGIAVLLVGLVVGLVYVVGLSALGGYLGNYLKHDTGIGG